MKEGWSIKKLGDVCAYLNRGVSPKYVEAGGTLVLNQRCVRDHRVSFEVSRRHDISVKPITKERFLQVGDVLVNSTGTGTLGRVAQLREEPTEPTTVDSHVTIVRPVSGMFFQDFFGYMLWDIEDQLKESGEGCGGQTELSRSVLAERFFVRFPTSLLDQQRIVGILDEAFEGIATAKSNTEQNLKNARAIFESELNAIFTKKGDGWEETRLGSKVDLLTGFAFKSQGYTSSDDGISLLRGDNIVQGAFRWANVKKWPKEDAETYEKFRLEENDIVLAMDRTWVNAGIKYAQVSQNDLPCLLLQRVARLRAGKKLEHRFLKYLISSPEFMRYVLSIQTGLGVPHISGKQIEDFKFYLPPINSQREIAGKLNKLDNTTQYLKVKYERKLSELDALKKSLLHHAFTGQL